MPASDLDWTFADIPAEDESAAPVSASPILAPPPPRRPLPRWLLWAAPAVLVVVVLGAWGFTRVGWSRLRAQVAAEVAREDERSLAGDVAAVTAMQAHADPRWVAQRAQQVAAGLPAPLPAPHLRPTGRPPRIVAFETVAPGRFAATVVREYADAAGAVYEFEHAQRYHNLGPGLWQRLPDDDAYTAAASVYTGAYLTITYPSADAAWITAAAPRFEAALAQACAHWQCPPDIGLHVVFGPLVAAEASDPDAPASHGAAQAALIFAAPPIRPSYAAGRYYQLASPHLAGYPRDDRAAAALTRATTAQLLGLLAGELAGGPRLRADYFLDALIAREEARQGLSAAVPPAVAPLDFAPPEALWQLSTQGTVLSGAVAPALRPQVLAFLDAALAGQPPSADAALLRALRAGGGLNAWLAGALGPDAAAGALARWRGVALGPPPAASIAGFEGVVLTCGLEAVAVTPGGLQRLSAHPQGQLVIGAALSPDGQRLAALIAGRSSRKLVVFNLVDGTQQPLPVARPAVLLGWQPGGALLYMEVHPANGESNVYQWVRLRQYDPATGDFSTPFAEPVVLPWVARGAWSPDRQSLALAFQRGGAPEAQPTLSLLSAGVAPDLAVGHLSLGTAGYGPAFAPDGERLAFFAGDPYPDQTNRANWRVNVLHWPSGRFTTLLNGADLEGGYAQAGGLEWSPDGRWLTFIALGARTPPVVFLAPAEGGPARRLSSNDGAPGAVPLGFSPDSRYLAVQVFSGSLFSNLVEVYDLAAPPGAAPQRYFAQAAAWSPAGHHLLLGTASGLHAVDPVTGAAAWVYDMNCGNASL